MLPPQNHSTLQSGSWYFTIDGLDSVVYKLSNFVIPAIEVAQDKIGNQSQNYVKYPSGRIEYDNLVLDYQIDADMHNYRKLFELLKKSIDIPQYFDVNVYILSGEKQLQNLTITFRECNITSMTPILLDANNSKTTVMGSCVMTFVDMEFN